MRNGCSFMIAIVIVTFSDINECDTANICGIGGTCSNTEGSYECTCDDGYIGGGDATPCTGLSR